MKKRLLSLLLAIVMVIGLVPAMVIGVGADGPLPTTFTSGGCDVIFTLNTDGSTYTATVKASEGGTGKMAADISMGDTLPYKAYNTITTKVVIDSSVKELGQGCFTKFSALKEIVWPETLQFTSIPSQAFLASGLERVEIPEGITTVANTAFISTVYSTDDHMLKQVVLPSTITSLKISGSYAAFAVASNASLVTLICKNEYSYNWAQDNGFFAVYYPANQIDGTDIFWSYSPVDNSLKVFGTGSIPDYTLESPAPWSAYTADISALVLTNGLTGIGDYAFYGMTSLFDIDVPTSVTDIGDYAFAIAEEDIWNTSYFKNTNIECEISDVALCNRTRVVYIGFPADAIQLGYCGSGSNGSYATNAQFYISSDGTLVIMGTGYVGDMNYNGNKAPWYENRTLITGLEVRDGITGLSYGSFAGLPNLLWENVDITDAITTYPSNLFFASGNGWDVVVPSHITSINKTYVFGSSVSTAPQNIKSITFENPNTSLATTGTVSTINGGRIGNVIIYYHNNGEDCSVKTFAETWGYTYIDLDTVTEEENILEYNLSYTSVNNDTLILSAIDPSQPITIPTEGYWLTDTSKESFTHLEITDGIINIPDNAFSGYTGLTSVQLSNTLTTIGAGAFSVDADFSEMTIEIPHSVTSIADDAFDGRTVTLKIPGESPVVSYEATGVTVIRTLKVLLVGNSFSQDAAWANISDYSQTWRVFDSLMEDDTELILGLIETGGKGLGFHATYDREGKKEQEFTVAQYKNGVDGKWTSYGAYLLKDAFSMYEWDVISLQMNSSGVEDAGSGDAIVAEDLRPISASIPYLLDRIQALSPSAKVYLYNVWQYTSVYDTIEHVLSASNSGYLNRLSIVDTAKDYTSTDGEFGITGVIHVATAIQNARTTYLSTLSNNIGTTSSMSNDNLMGLQRDGSHISYSMGRYIVGLTFAKTIIPSALLKEGAVDAGPRDSLAIGAMPAEYVEIARAAVDAAIASPTEITTISGYTVDPAITAQAAVAALNDENYYGTGCADNDALAAAINAAAIAAAEEAVTEIEADDLVISTVVNSFDTETGAYNATTSIRFGYTTMTAEFVKSEAPAAPTLFNDASISLKDNTWLNFYTFLTDENVENYTYTYVIDGVETEIDTEEMLKKMSASNELGYEYRLSVALKPYQLAEDVTVNMYDLEGNLVCSKTDSIRDYAGRRLEASQNENYKAALRALLEYGAAVQVYQNYKTDNLANSILH